MPTAANAYFGWSQPAHRPDCKRPAWEVDSRPDYSAWRPRNEGCDHSCPNEGCEHGNEYECLTVRLVCRSCDLVRRFRGESYELAPTTTAATGYGTPPRKVGALWLYAGPPLLYDGTEPDEYLCAPERVDRLEPEHVVGSIGRHEGQRGGVSWKGAALPEIITPRYTPRPYLTYTVVSGDVRFRSVKAAANWVQAQVEAAGDAAAPVAAAAQSSPRPPSQGA
ncbi:hypothetical protein [Actinophytocola sp.]|uniref:hypothetical protein n=1 Tax=Actinophytocola sp. TaxID=1872138 RepID=UPI002ED1209B